jgi:RNA polymerase sigma-70 factor (TIGR02943 family)
MRGLVPSRIHFEPNMIPPTDKTRSAIEPGTHPAGSPAGETRNLDPERWVDEHGDYLFHYALSRVREPARAEDFVQEALLGGLRSADRYQGRSSERTWLTGILKNKLLDHFRKAGRETNFTDLEFFAEEEDRAFENQEFPDHWNSASAPSEWNQAGEALDREQFWRVFHECSGKLPERIARVFLLREVDGMTGEEICSSLNITPNNLWVMLHRARLALRGCLQLNWFDANRGQKDTA